MILRLIFLALGMATLSCSPLQTSSLNGREDIAYQPAGVVRYFLPDIPAWANSSVQLSCFRSGPIKYLDHGALRSSFDYSYTEAIQFQLLYNIEWRKLKELAYRQSIPVREKENLFFRVSDMIKARLYPFRVPSFERVHLILVDDFITSPQRIRELQILLNSEKMSLGHPVFVSLCRNYTELENFMEQHNLHQQNIRLLSAEVLSPYGIEGDLRPFSKLNLDLFFTAEQKLYFYSPQGIQPLEIEGNIQLQSF